MTEVFNHCGNSSHYNYFWFFWTTLGYIDGENMKLTAIKCNINKCGEPEGLHGSSEGGLHSFVIVFQRCRAASVLKLSILLSQHSSTE